MSQNEINTVREGETEAKAITEDEAKSKGLVRATDGDLSQFAHTVIDWHSFICNQGNHVLNIDNSNPADPNKIAVRVREPDHPDADEDGIRVLTDEELIPFKHGVRFMLDLFEDLPFQYTPTDADGNVLAGYGATGKADAAEEQTAPESGSGS